MSEANVNLRVASESDLPAILAIYAPYVENTCFSLEYDVPTLEEFTERFRRITSGYPYFVAESDGRIVGYAYGSRAFERAGYAWDADISVYLSEDVHGKGIGRMLVEKLESELKSRGICNIYSVITGENKVSVAFHESLGYTIAGTLHKAGFKHGRWLDVHYYEKRINDPEVPKQ